MSKNTTKDAREQIYAQIEYINSLIRAVHESYNEPIVLAPGEKNIGDKPISLWSCEYMNGIYIPKTHIIEPGETIPNPHVLYFIIRDHAEFVCEAINHYLNNKN